MLANGQANLGTHAPVLQARALGETLVVVKVDERAERDSLFGLHD